MALPHGIEIRPRVAAAQQAARQGDARPPHGIIARWLQHVTDDALRVEEGSLYSALHRLEKRGFVEASWGLSETNWRAKFYRPTTRGRS